MRYFLYKQTTGRSYEIYSCMASNYGQEWFSRGASEIEISKEVFYFLKDALDRKLTNGTSVKLGKPMTYFIYTPV